MRRVSDEQARCTIMQYVVHLGGGQAKIDGDQNEPLTTRSNLQFEALRRIHAEQRYPIAAVQAYRAQIAR